MHRLTTLLIFLVGLVLVGHSFATHHRPTHRHHVKDMQNELQQIEDEDKRLALLHSQRVSEVGTCEVPKQQVIHVNDHYPGKYYLPHCTLLHRCGKHAGCCGLDSLKCVAAKKEKVTLYFYSVKFAEDELVERKVEKLVFSNHTKCACVSVGHLSKHDL